MLHTLRQLGADVHSPDRARKTPLMFAVRYGYGDIISSDLAAGILESGDILDNYMSSPTKDGQLEAIKVKETLRIPFINQKSFASA